MIELRPTRASFVLFLALLCQYASFSDAAFGSKKKRKQLEEEALRAEQERLAKLVTIFGIEIDEKHLYVYLFTSLVALTLSALLFCGKSGESKRIGNRCDIDDTVDVIVVGLGLPKKGMGWYHLTQLLEMPKVNVRGVVEPFFMNPELCKQPPLSWTEFVISLKPIAIEVVASVSDLSNFNSKKKTMCLIAGRTPDNPNLFKDCIAKGANVIYLEKPGAPSVKALEDMNSLASRYNVNVYMGYNKNVTPYVRNALDLARQTPNSQVVFCHNNSYRQRDLPEVFTRNSEGMFKNMAIHELALLVTFFGVTVDTIKEFRVDTNKQFSEKLSVWKPGSSLSNPEYISDFSRVAFEVTTADGVNVGVMADRCGGNVSFALVKDAKGNDIKKFEFPDAEMTAQIEEKVRADREMMPYFHIQSDDYLELKSRVVNSTLENKNAEGVATILVGIEALKLAEYGTDHLTDALKSA